MRKLLLGLLLALPCVASGIPILPQTAVCSMNTPCNGGGGAVSFPLLAPNGSVSAPSYSFTNCTGCGLYGTATTVNLAAGGVQAFVANSTQVVLGNGSVAAPTGVSVIGQTASGTDAAGGSITINGGAASAGNADGGTVILNGGSPIGSGVTGSINLGVNSPLTPLKLGRTVTAGGTTGAQTINKMGGTVNFAAAATSLVVTDSLVNTSSIVFTTIRTADTTCTFVKSVVPAAGSFTITVNAGCAAETSVGFWVTN